MIARFLARLALPATTFGIFATCACLAPGTSAHEARPAYLEIIETEAERYQILWRTPLRPGSRLAVVLRLPEGTRAFGDRSEREFRDSVVERFTVEVPGGLAGKRIEFVGLETTITDVLVRMEDLGGSDSTAVVTPSEPWLEIQAARGLLDVAAAYVAHGIRHILSGYDHLLFVVALYLVARNRRSLLIAITAFTVGHSMTLAATALGAVRLPSPPIEAAIALSIVLLACEALRQQRTRQRPGIRSPGSLAFCFGLLHGLGFASALTALGLPDGSVPLALLAFNTGVEIGQIAFIAAMTLLILVAVRVGTPARVRALGCSLTAHAVGIAGSFWFFERLAGFTP